MSPHRHAIASSIVTLASTAALWCSACSDAPGSQNDAELEDATRPEVAPTNPDTSSSGEIVAPDDAEGSDAVAAPDAPSSDTPQADVEAPLASTTFTVDEHGAVMELGEVRVAFPPGAAPAGTLIAMEVRPARADGWSQRVRFGPSGLTFAGPVMVSFVATRQAPPGQELLVLWSRPDGTGSSPTTTWRTIGEREVVHGYVGHFSEGELGPAPACAPPTAYRCWDGRCVGSQPECATSAPGSGGGGGGEPPPSPCGADTPVFCPDGSCRPASDTCETTPSTCPSDLPHACLDGRCAASSDDCRCVGTAAGPGCLAACPPTEPVRCGERCLAVGERCAPGPCPGGRERCRDGVTCAPSEALCPNSCERYGYVTCLSGFCEATPSLCIGRNGCPETRPHRCGDATRCEVDAADCSAPSCEERGETTCWLNGCQPSEAECLRPDGCTRGKPVLCGDGTCESADSQCTIPPALDCWNTWHELDYPVYHCGAWLEAPNPYRPFYRAACGTCLVDFVDFTDLTVPYCGPGRAYCIDMDVCIPKDGTCRNGRPPCEDGTRQCDATGGCLANTEPCEGACVNEGVLCAARNACLRPDEPCDAAPDPVCESDEWRCGSRCIPTWQACEGTCPTGQRYCPGEHRCRPDNESCAEMCSLTALTWTCGEACLARTERCNRECAPNRTWCPNDGQCRANASQCTPTCEVEEWLCDRSCQARTEPCQGTCPPELKLCYVGSGAARTGRCVGLGYEPCSTTP